MEEFILWFLCFIVVYLVYLILVINNKKKLIKYGDSTEVKYLKNKFKINVEKMGIKKLAKVTCLANAFIISSAVSLVCLLDNIILMLILAVVILIPFIIVVYNIVGTVLVKKYGIQKK